MLPLFTLVSLSDPVTLVIVSYHGVKRPGDLALGWDSIVVKLELPGSNSGYPLASNQL